MRAKKLIFILLALTACTQEPAPQPSVQPSDEPSAEPSVEPVVPVDPGPVGERLLDVVFAPDGTAADTSPQALTMNTVSGGTVMAYLQPDAEVYAPRFWAAPGTSVGTGFYRARYASGTPFAQGLADGHSLECVLMCDFDAARLPDATVSAFSGLERGGSGLYVKKTFCFEVGLSGGVSVIADSGVIPQRGVYYHLLGVYDADRAEVRIYVDGVLKGSAPAEGRFAVPPTKAACWYGIGVDATPSGLATGAWSGDIIAPRIYDNALTDAHAAALSQAAPACEPYTMRITATDYLTDISLRPGSAFRFFADGLQEGDRLLFAAGGNTVDLPATFHPARGFLSAPVTTELQAEEYALLVGRGRQLAPVGNVRLTVAADAEEPRRPAAVAHRGWWLSTAVPENSVAALKAAQDGGCEAAEMDIWITTDGEVYVNHDGTLDGVRIENSTSETVGRLTLTNGEPIPTLDQYLDQHARNTATTLVIEVKTHASRARNDACVDAALAAVDRHGLADHVQYIAFDLENCRRIAKARPGAMVGYLNGDLDPLTLKEMGVMQLDYQTSPFTFHPEWIRTAHANGMLVNMWTLDKDEDIKLAIQLGADYITTNAPERVFALREKYFD